MYYNQLKFSYQPSLQFFNKHSIILKQITYKTLLLNIIFLKKQVMLTLTKKFYNEKKTYPTNILLFQKNKNYHKKKCIKQITINDIFICHKIIKKESKNLNKNFFIYIQQLILHSILHGYGCTHITDNDTIFMKILEEKLFNKINFTNY